VSEPDSISHEDARRHVLQPGVTTLWKIAYALDAEDAALPGGVSAKLAVDLLSVGDVENWRRTTEQAEASAGLFQPQSTIVRDDGKSYRSFLPEDLSPEDEAPIRELANASANHAVRARLFEVLWARFKQFPDASAAMDARLSAAPAYDAEENWPELVRNLGRAITLAMSVRSIERFAPLVAALDQAANALRACSRAFGFPVLADMVCNTLLKSAQGRETFTSDRGRQWAVHLGEIADKYREDTHHGYDALVVLQAWYLRWGNSADAQVIRRRIVTDSLDAAQRADPHQATWLAERALEASLNFGISDLSQLARGRLSSAVRSTVSSFKEFSSSSTIPAELINAVLEPLRSGVPLPGALRRLALLEGILDVDLPQLREGAREYLKERAFLGLINTQHFSPDGKVRFQSEGYEGNVEYHAKMMVGMHLALVEELLRRFLLEAAPQLEPGTMLKALADWPLMPVHRRALLQLASEHFGRRDWASSAFIVATTYEAVLRDLLRAGGYPALKVERGIQLDETLNSLLRAAVTRNILGNRNCDLADYVLCDSALGWNLRNDIAHGTVHLGSLSPARVLLLWLLVIRLTCFVPEEPSAPGVEPETAGEDLAASSQ
jgi:hypothetical protein